MLYKVCDVIQYALTLYKVCDVYQYALMLYKVCDVSQCALMLYKVCDVSQYALKENKYLKEHMDVSFIDVVVHLFVLAFVWLSHLRALIILTLLKGTRADSSCDTAKYTVNSATLLRAARLSQRINCTNNTLMFYCVWVQYVDSL